MERRRPPDTPGSRRIESRATVLNRAAEDLGDLLGEIVSVNLPAANARGVTLELGLEAQGQRSFVDRFRIGQAIGNLVDNAIKFTPRDGRVSIKARSVGGETEIVVADNGPGIAAEALPHVFDRFWQERHARRAGAGLGLAIAKGWVEAHGGRVRVESRVGEGSVFTICIPEGGAAPTPQSSSPPAAR